jgi:prolyl oligopeptidase
LVDVARSAKLLGFGRGTTPPPKEVTLYRKSLAATLAVTLCASLWASQAPSPKKPAYPKTPVRVVTDNYFGTKIEDPYRWLEKGDDPEVVAWTEAQNAFTRKFLDALPQRPLIAEQLKTLWNFARQGTPAQAGPYLFFTKNDGLQNQSPVMVQEGLAGPPRVLIDPNTLSADGTVALDWWYPSEKGKYVAYGASANGDEQSVLRVRETATGKDLPDVMDGCRSSSVAWLLDESGFYYTRFPRPGTVPEGEINYNQRLLFHKLGTDPEKDVLVFSVPGKKEVGFGVQLSNTGRYLLITAAEGSDRNTEIYVKDLETGAFMQLAKGSHDAYDGEIYGDTFFCRTTEGAPNGRVFAVDLRHPQRDAWKLIVPEGKDAIEGVGIIDRRLAVQLLHDATSQVKFYALDGTLQREVPLPALGTVSGVSGRWDSALVFVPFTSFAYPPSVFRYDLEKNELEPFFRPKVPVDLSDIETEQVWYASKDGTKVSMFVVHKKGLKRDGSTPCFLTGYGGFSISEQPYYSPVSAWWLAQGGVWALPNLRGGGEYGEAWHKAGMLGNKQNVFDDFIAAAQWLIANKVTSTPKLCIEGGSNGGLLTGACLVQRPDLFGCVLVEVPLLDMLRYQNFSIARYWIPEYGSSENKDQFKFLLKYSPYQNAPSLVAYPPTLFMAGASDSRVDPLHARKMTALIQAHTTGTAPILLRVESKAGHGQGKPTSKRIDEAADRYAFITEALGMTVK